MPFPASKKLKILNKVLKEGKTVSKVCREAGIARKTFYQWKKRYQQAPPRIKKQALELNYASGKHHPKNKRYKFEDRVISIIVSHPSWGSRKISAILCKHRQEISNHAVYSLLEDLNLETKEKREEFSSLYQTFARIEKIYQPKPLRLTPEVRKRVIEEVVIGEEPVSQVCQKYRLSRKTFYKWLARYQEAREKEAVLLQAMEDNYIKGFAHPRSVSEEVQEKILSLVRQRPAYSTHKVAQILAEVGNHGVQNVFQKLNLNTYEKRLAYAQAYQPVTIPVPGVLGRLKPILGRIPVVSAIPPPTREEIASLARPFIFSFLSSIAFSTILIYWLRMLSQAPTLGAKLGLFFASVALLVGGFFFAYSMKYYLTLAIVLSFSRQPLEEGRGFAVSLNGRLNNNQRNGPSTRASTELSRMSSGWLQKIFGLGNGNGERKEVVQAGGLQPSLEHIKLKRYPFVSIHLPFYNERKVAERILKACTAMNYPNYEIIVCDDSTDETTKIVERFAKKHNKAHPHGPKIKVLHRPTRQGFKGGALGYALEHMSPKTEFVVVFDADFIPYPDTLELFVKYFKANNQDREDYTKSNVAVVGGYQWHVLNKSENWITRGVRTEYAGSYVIERPGQEILGAMKLIHGSVYAIRADILRKFGWGTSITEDFELTLRLYAQGYKVIYTPYIQAPAECASTLKRLIRQRMRWAEGHSNNIRRMFIRLISSPKLTLPEKLELLYISPYYLQAFFFLIGTFSWLLAETVFRARLPFWTSLWGWSLVLTNFFSLPLMNAVGLFLEESEEKDYAGIISFILLSYILVPFQAYASVKGFIEKEEGPWFRTPKTGKITDIFTRGRFYRWISGILPGRVGSAVSPLATVMARNELRYSHLNARRYTLDAKLNPYVALETANNRFDKPPVVRKAPQVSFFDQSKQFAFLGVKVARRVVFSKATLALLLVVTMFLNYMAFFTIETPKKVEKVERVEKGEMGGGTEIFRGEPVNTNLIENGEAVRQSQGKQEGVVYAAEDERLASSGERLGDEEVYRWNVELPRATYSFGLQESGGIKPVVKMENERRGGNFVRFTPDTRMETNAGVFDSLKRMLTNERMYVEPRVEGNSIKWKLGEGITAKYTALADRIKADYVIENRGAFSGEGLAFSVKFSDQDDNPLVFEQNEDGSISLIMENYSEEIFRFLAPTVEDAEGKEGEAEMSIQKTGLGTAILTITLDPDFLASATYPITVDPTTLDSTATSVATAYGNARHILRNSDNDYVAVISNTSGGSTIVGFYSNDAGATWGNRQLEICSSVSPCNIFAVGMDSSDNMHLVYERNGSIIYRKVTDMVTSNDIDASWTLSSRVTLDSSTYAYRPSLITTKMGSNDHVAVAWSFYGKSGGTRRSGVRFMHCLLSNDCTSLTYWCGANANSGAECGEAATDLAVDGDADLIFMTTVAETRHVVLNQMNPTGDASTTYSKDLVIVAGNDGTNDLGTGYTGWGDTANCGDGTTNCWAGWSENATNITATQYDDADGFNLTLAQDNLNKKLVLSYHDTTNSHLEALRLGEGVIPTGSWTDLSFPTGDNKDPTVGVDNTNGIYYNFYRNFNQYIAFRQADGVNFGSTLGNTGGGGPETESCQNIIVGDKFTLSATKTFTEITFTRNNVYAANVRTAIYTDSSGTPNTLVVQSDSTAASTAIVTTTVEPTTLSAGNYWLVVNSDDVDCSVFQLSGAGITKAYTYAAFPFNFPASPSSTSYDYEIYAKVGWSGEIVLDQTSTGPLVFPSVTEAAINTSTNKKMDLIYTGGVSPYSVYYHTWHFEERYSYGNATGAPSGYVDQRFFMDEQEYNSQSIDDTNYTSQSANASGGVYNTGVFLFKLRNTNRSANPDIDPTWEGCFARGSTTDTIYLQIYNRDTASWETMDTDTSSSACSVEGDFKQLSPASTFSGAKYYFADDWVYVRVNVTNSDNSGPHNLYSDWFDTTNIWVPERTLLTLLVLALFLPRIIREFKLRKELAYEKAETREINL